MKVKELNHMRKLKFESAKDLFRFTESLLNDSSVLLVLQRLANSLCLDLSVLKRYFGNAISNAYDHKLGKFEFGLSRWSIVISIGQVFLFLLLVLVLSKKENLSGKGINCHVLVDGIQTNAEL